MLLVGVSVLLILAPLAISGWLAVRQSSEQVSQERQAPARTTARYLDYVLGQNLARLDSIRLAEGVDIEDGDLEPEKRTLHSAYLGSIFDDGVFVADQRGMVLWAEPFRQDFVGTNISSYPTIWQSFSSRKPSISDVVTIEPSGKKAIFVVTPLPNKMGRVVGLVGGMVDPTGRALQDIARLVEPGKTSRIDVIDSNGLVLTSSDPRRILTRKQDDTNRQEPEVTELAYLSIAPWSVAVTQPESEALAPVRTMEQRFIIFGISSLVIALFLGLGLTLSLVKPIRELTAAAQDISRGNISRPIPRSGSDEIGDLSQSLDVMRTALKRSLDEIQEWNKALETRVQEKTRELEKSYREIARKEAARGELLRKVLSVQEEERKRIARELHDETSQSLAALVMRLEAAVAIPDRDAEKIKNSLADMRNLATRTMDNVHKIIFDLRPSVLDDLGLLSALRWYADNRLGAPGIRTRVEVTGEERKLPPQVETSLFRVVQEAITNIVKHAEAHNVLLSVEFKDSAIAIEVEDDGKGFDMEAVGLQMDKAPGLGLLGMKERVTLLGGEFHIESQPGSGTRIDIEVPLS